MDGSRLLRLSCLLGAAVLGVLMVFGTGSGRAAMAAPSVVHTVLAGPYRLVLQIGPLEKMWTEAQVSQLHPKTGEVMLSGAMSMSDMSGMDAAMPNHHLELHVYDRTTGKVVVKAMVSIIVRSPDGKMLVRLPIAVMRGVNQGVSDTHFGNNVSLKDGHYTVDVQVAMTRATFKVSLGGGMTM